MKPFLATFVAAFSVVVSVTVSAADRTVILTRFTDTLGEIGIPNTSASAVTLFIVPKDQPFPTPPPPPAAIPTAAVVIPADAAGPVQIVLESSVDMVTWTAANPGTYAASTAQRFFRVRAIQQPTP